MDELLTRRGTLLRLAGLVAAGLGIDAWKAGDGPAGVASGGVKCILAPEQTEGPYYIANEKVRRNITDGRRGVPLTLRATVVDASTCKPIKGAAVDIWHCDAGGVYSGFGQGASSRTFLRGMQRTNVNGLALLKTIYPGWYQGRTVHIHVKVHVGGNVVHTGQLYFPDTLTDKVYRKAPYSSRPGRTTRNANDFVFFNGGKNSLLSVRSDGSGGYVAAITMGVVRSLAVEGGEALGLLVELPLHVPLRAAERRRSRSGRARCATCPRPRRRRGTSPRTAASSSRTHAAGTASDRIPARRAWTSSVVSHVGRKRTGAGVSGSGSGARGRSTSSRSCSSRNRRRSSCSRALLTVGSGSPAQSATSFGRAGPNPLR